MWSRETGSAVPPRVSLLISILRLNLVLTYGIPPEFRGGVYIFHIQKNENAAQIGRLSPADHERDRPPCTSTQNVRSKLSLPPMITCGMLRRSRCIQIFFKQQQQKALWHLSPCVGCSEGLDAFRFTKKTALLVHREGWVRENNHQDGEKVYPSNQLKNHNEAAMGDGDVPGILSVARTIR